MSPEQDDQSWKRYLQLAASGGLTGAAMGGLGKILSGSRQKLPIGIAAGLGGLVGATAIPGASYIGEQILGEPDENDTTAYTKRTAVGGGVVGGVGGAGVGSLIGSGLAKEAGIAAPGLAKIAKANLPLDNLIIDQIKKRGGLKGAILGGILGAGGLGFMAADEGQQFDTMRNLTRRKPDVVE